MKKHYLIFALLAAFLYQGVALASVGVKDEDAYIGQAADLDFSTGLVVTDNGSRKTITVGESPTVTTLTATTVTTSALNTTGTVALGDTSLDKTTVIGQLYIPYYSKTAKAASGTSEGTIIMSKGVSRNDCGHGTAGNANVLTVCMSDGTDWIAV